MLETSSTESESSFATAPHPSILDPKAAEFVPRRYSSDLCPAAPKINVELDLLERLPRMDPALPEHGEDYAASAEIITAERALLEDQNQISGSLTQEERRPSNGSPISKRLGGRRGFLSSTPVGPSNQRGRLRCRDIPIRERGPRLSVRDWSFLPWRRNRRRRRNLNRKISYSDEEEMRRSRTRKRLG